MKHLSSVAFAAAISLAAMAAPAASQAAVTVLTLPITDMGSGSFSVPNTFPVPPANGSLYVKAEWVGVDLSNFWFSYAYDMTYTYDTGSGPMSDTSVEYFDCYSSTGCVTQSGSTAYATIAGPVEFDITPCTPAEPVCSKAFVGPNPSGFFYVEVANVTPSASLTLTFSTDPFAGPGPAPIPEPGTWLTLILGTFAVGGALRANRRRMAQFA